MTENDDQLLCRLIGGDDKVTPEIIERATISTSPELLVAAALVDDEPSETLARAARIALTTRDRQLVAIASVHVSGDEELLDVLVRDHLADHPDNILAAWIAAHHTRSSRPAGTIERSENA
jgi:alkylhydroperoxidase/carboxymuconolactone decarboxylase family protein YurZ